MLARSEADICNIALVKAGVNQKIGSLTERSPAAQACNTIYVEARRKVLSAFRWFFSIKRLQLTPYTGSTYDATLAYGLGQYAQYGSNVYRSLLAANTGHQPNLDASAAWWAQVTRDGWAWTYLLPDDWLNLISIYEKTTSGGVSSSPVITFPQDQNDTNLRNPRSSGRVPFAIENSNDGTDSMVLLTDLDAPILVYCSDVTQPASYPSTFITALSDELSGPLAMALRGDEKKAAMCMQSAKNSLADAFISDRQDEQEDVEPISEFEAAREG